MLHKRILKLTMLVMVAILIFFAVFHVGRNQLRKLWFLDNGSVSLQMQEKTLIERLGEPNQTTQPIENQRQRILTYADAFVSFGSDATRVDYLVNIHTDRVECVMTEIPADSQEDAEKLGFTYAALDAYIRDGVEPDAATKARIDRLYKLNRFKVRFMDVFPYRPE